MGFSCSVISDDVLGSCIKGQLRKDLPHLGDYDMQKLKSALGEDFYVIVSAYMKGNVEVSPGSFVEGVLRYNGLPACAMYIPPSRDEGTSKKILIVHELGDNFKKLIECLKRCATDDSDKREGRALILLSEFFGANNGVWFSCEKEKGICLSAMYCSAEHKYTENFDLTVTITPDEIVDDSDCYSLEPSAHRAAIAVGLSTNSLFSLPVRHKGYMKGFFILEFDKEVNKRHIELNFLNIYKIYSLIAKSSHLKSNKTFNSGKYKRSLHGRIAGVVNCKPSNDKKIDSIDPSMAAQSLIVSEINERATTLLNVESPLNVLGLTIDKLFHATGGLNSLSKGMVSLKDPSEIEVHLINTEINGKDLQVRARLVNRGGINEFLMLTILDLGKMGSQLDTLSRSLKIDSLTNLPNRQEFIKDLNINCKSGFENATIALFDLKDTSYLNQAVGVEKVDQIITDLARQVTAFSVFYEGKAYRIYGDQIALLAINVKEATRFHKNLYRYISTIVPAAHFQGQLITCQLSCGVVSFNSSNKKLEELFSFSEAALKKSKKNCIPIHVFDDHDLEEFALRREVIAKVMPAMENSDIYPVYQPKNCLKTGKVFSYEALARWENPIEKFQLPTFFIPILEESQYIHRFTLYMIENVVKDILAYEIKEKISINVSPHCLMLKTFSKEVQSILTSHDFSGSKIMFEVTESTLLIKSPIVEKNLSSILGMGINLSIDDFGAGYTSLSLLTEIPLHELKIDMQYIKTAKEKPFSTAVIRSSLLLADSLGIDMCVEGVESEDQAAMLVNMGCKIGQGYLYSLPQNAQAMFGRNILPNIKL